MSSDTIADLMRGKSLVCLNSTIKIELNLLVYPFFLDAVAAYLLVLPEIECSHNLLGTVVKSQMMSQFSPVNYNTFPPYAIERGGIP